MDRNHYSNGVSASAINQSHVAAPRQHTRLGEVLEHADQERLAALTIFSRLMSVRDKLRGPMLECSPGKDTAAPSECGMLNVLNGILKDTGDVHKNSFELLAQIEEII